MVIAELVGAAAGRAHVVAGGRRGRARAGRAATGQVVALGGVEESSLTAPQAAARAGVDLERDQVGPADREDARGSRFDADQRAARQERVEPRRQARCPDRPRAWARAAPVGERRRGEGEREDARRTRAREGIDRGGLGTLASRRISSTQSSAVTPSISASGCRIRRWRSTAGASALTSSGIDEVAPLAARPWRVRTAEARSRRAARRRRRASGARGCADDVRDVLDDAVVDAHAGEQLAASRAALRRGDLLRGSARSSAARRSPPAWLRRMCFSTAAMGCAR